MGAWTHDPFGNDDALELLEDIAREGLFAIGAALQPALEMEYLRAPEASQVVAAAALVAVSRGLDLPLPRDAQELAVAMGPPPADLLVVARKALEKVVARSELEALWAEGDGYDGWLATVSRIQAALT